MTSTAVGTRRCAWKDCQQAAKPQGKRGPIPRYCEAHTAERKRVIRHNPRKPRGLRPECCTGGHLCPQHEQFRDEIRIPVYPLSKRETAWLIEQFDTAEAGSLGFHITGPANPKGWNTDSGPWEGRTRPEVFSPDPSSDGDWFTANPKWWLSQYDEWPSMYDGPDMSAWLDDDFSDLEYAYWDDDEGEKYLECVGGKSYA